MKGKPLENLNQLLFLLSISFLTGGLMLEWLMGTDCKSAGDAYAGSNPARPKLKIIDSLNSKKSISIELQS